MRKKIRNIVFAVLVIGCILTSNLNLITAYALDDTSEADIRTFLFDMTYEGTRVEGTTIEVFEMNFASNDSVDKKYIKIAEGNNVVSCTLDLTRLTDENKILYVRYTLPEQYEFTRVEVDENNNPTDIPSDYELYWLDDLKASADGTTFSYTDIAKKAIPDTPDTPDEPTTPDKPDEPTTPDKPDEPTIPDEPDTPDTPDTPDMPDTPDEPTTPDTPTTPDEPTTPDTPDEPGTPDTPDAPDTPDDSTGATVTNQWNAVSAILTGTETNKVTVRNDAASGTKVEEDVLKDIFHTLKETGKEVTFSFEDENGNNAYSWTFQGNDINNPDAHISDFKVESNAKVEEVEEAVTATGTDTEHETIHFSHHGDLPGTATVTTKVELPNQKVYFYYYNPVTRFLELVSSDVVIQDGYATFQIEHCSDYILSTKELTTTKAVEPKTETPEIVVTPETQAESADAALIAVETSDETNRIGFAAACMMAGAALLFLGIKKMKTT